MAKKSQKFEKRIHEIDFLRGILIILVILDHLFWFVKTYSLKWGGDTNGVYLATNFYWTSGARQIIRQIVLFLFVFVSGISCSFSKNNWKRAGKMLIVWALLSIFTNVGDRLFNGGKGGWIIDFNVIGVLAWSILIYCFCQKMSWKGIAAVTLIMFLLSMMIVLIPQEIRNAVYLPALWAPDGLVRPAVENPVHLTGDWMPLFPYITFFFMGVLFSLFVYNKKQSLLTRHEWERGMCFIGRNTIWVYLAHEPVLLIIFGVLDAIIMGV